MVSGTKGDRVFYRKAVLSCDGREAVWHHIAREYPARMKPTYEPIVDHLCATVEQRVETLREDFDNQLERAEASTE